MIKRLNLIINKYPILVIFSAAIIVRLVFLRQLFAGPFFNVPLVDEITYCNFAVNFVTTGVLSGGAFWQAPLYQFFLSFVYWLAAGNFFLVIRIVQAVIGAVNCVLIYLVARNYSGKKNVALLAGLIAVFYGPFLFFEYELLNPVLEIFLNLLVLLLWERSCSSKKKGLLFLCGLFIGLSAITRGSILLLLPVFIIMIARQFQKKLAYSYFLFISAVILLILPVTIYNYARSGDFIPISYNTGINFYLGNNACYDEAVALKPNMEWIRLVNEPMQAGYIRYQDRSSYFFRKSWQWIKTNPKDFMQLEAKKLLLFLSANEVMRNTYIYAFRRYSSILCILLWKIKYFAFPFGFIFPLFLLGVLQGEKLRGAKSILYYYIGLLSLFVIMFFVTARYRLPVVPVMIVFAAQGLCWFREVIKAGKKKQIIGGILVIIVGLFITNYSVTEMSPEHDPNAYYQLAKHYYSQNGLVQAEKNYQQAFFLDSDYPDAVYGLGNVAYKKKDYQKALEYYQQAIEIAPDFPHAYRSAGLSYANMGNYDKAMEIYKKAAAAKIDLIRIYQEIAELYNNNYQDYDQALVYYKKVIKLGNKEFLPHYKIGLIYLDVYGDREAAKEYLEKAKQRCSYWSYQKKIDLLLWKCAEKS